MMMLLPTSPLDAGAFDGHFSSSSIEQSSVLCVACSIDSGFGLKIKRLPLPMHTCIQLVLHSRLSLPLAPTVS